MDIDKVDNLVYGLVNGNAPARVHRMEGRAPGVEEVRRGMRESGCEVVMYLGPNTLGDVSEELKRRYPYRMIRQVQYERVICLRYDLLWNDEEYYLLAIGSPPLSADCEGRELQYADELSFSIDWDLESHVRWYTERRCREYDVLREEIQADEDEIPEEGEDEVAEDGDDAGDNA